MPEWFLILLTVIFILAAILSAWTWVQALITHRAVEGNKEQRDLTRSVLYRLTGVFIAETTLSVVGVLSLTTVSAQLRAFRSILLVVMSLAVAWIGIHEYLRMRADLRND